MKERYEKAMKLAGYARVNLSTGDRTAAAFRNIKTGREIEYASWRLVGTDLEAMRFENEDTAKQVDELIHPQGRLSYYTANLGENGDFEPNLHSGMEQALADYLKAETNGRQIGYCIGGSYKKLAQFDAAVMEHRIYFPERISLFTVAPEELALNEIRELDRARTGLNEILRQDTVFYHSREEAEPRLFVDMDGTLAKFQALDTMEKLFEEGYFEQLEPQINVVEAVRQVIRKHPEIPVYIMSSVLSDSKYALQEKNKWLDKYLPEIDVVHRIFPPCGENKLDYVPKGIKSTDYLLDDYTHNLILWEPPARGIKLLNGINHTNESWQKNMLRYDKTPELLMENIVDIINGKQIRDERPISQRIALANQKYSQNLENHYISEDAKHHLEFLTEHQAVKAVKEGVYICAVGKFPEYHGSHKDEYSIWKIKSLQEVRKLYSGFRTDFYSKAFVSPAYNEPGELKRILQQSCEETIRRNSLKADQPVKEAMP